MTKEELERELKLVDQAFIDMFLHVVRQVNEMESLLEKHTELRSQLRALERPRSRGTTSKPGSDKDLRLGAEPNEPDAPPV